MARKKLASGNFFTDTMRFFKWGGKKVGGRLKGKGKGFFHRMLVAMRR